MEITVKKLISILEKMNPDSVVCSLEIYDDYNKFNSFEVCREIHNTYYINDNGDYVKGDIVVIY